MNIIWIITLLALILALFSLGYIVWCLENKVATQGSIIIDQGKKLEILKTYATEMEVRLLDNVMAAMTEALLKPEEDDGTLTGDNKNRSEDIPTDPFPYCG